MRADTTSSTALGTFHAAALHLIRPRRQLLLCRCPRTSDRYRSPCNAGTRSQCGTARTTCPGGLSHSRDTACKFPRPECRSQNKCERPCCTSAVTAEWMMVVVLPSSVKQLALNPVNLDPIPESRTKISRHQPINFQFAGYTDRTVSAAGILRACRRKPFRWPPLAP